jgi:hypothetical protein
MDACKHLNLVVVAKSRGGEASPGSICKIEVKEQAAGLVCSPPPILLNYAGWLSNILVEILQVLAHGHHELVSVRAVNDAVIVADGKPDDVANSN